MKYWYSVAFFCLFFVFVRPVVASYVLPYPSYMPGSKLYRISRVMDEVRLVWSFGTIAQVKANMALADKYFVEAKTLFEYKQYLLGTQALARSNRRLEAIPQLFTQGMMEGKDMTLYKTAYREDLAIQSRHLDVLLDTLPKEFLWTPEKAEATHLPLGQLLEKAKMLRMELSQL